MNKYSLIYEARVYGFNRGYALGFFSGIVVGIVLGQVIIL